MSELGKEELLESLRHALNGVNLPYEAYAQLVEIVKQHFEDDMVNPITNGLTGTSGIGNESDTDTEGVDEEWEEEFERIVEDEDLAPPNRSALALDMAKQLLTQKPQKQSGEVEE